MVRRNELIKEIRNMTAAVADAMAAVSLFVGYEEDERDALGGCKYEADVIRDSIIPLKERLYEVLDCIREDWNAIIQNDLLCNDVKTLLEVCSGFHKKAFEFDEATVLYPRVVEGLLGDAWLPRAYLVLMYEWEDEASAIREYVMKNCGLGTPLDNPFRGIASRLRHFFTGVTDEEFEKFVMNGVSLAVKPRWMSDKRQAVVMGKLLGKSCKDMNDSFLFCKKDGTPVLLNYTQNGPKLEMDQYEIYGVIKPLIGVTDRKRQQ